MTINFIKKISLTLAILFNVGLIYSQSNSYFQDKYGRVDFEIPGKIEENFLSYDADLDLELNTLVVNNSINRFQALIVYGFKAGNNKDLIMDAVIYGEESVERVKIIDHKANVKFNNLIGDLYLYTKNGKRPLVGVLLTSVRPDNTIFYISYVTEQKNLKSGFKQEMNHLLNSIKL